MFKKRLNKDKINNCHVWEEELPDGSYDMGFNGNLNHMEKRKSGYVTQKQFSEFKDANNQRLIKIETTLATQGEQLNQLIKVVILQGEQIKELQVEQKAQGEQIKAKGEQIKAQSEQIKTQGETLKLILQALGGINKRLDKVDPPK
ncbi:DUF16 domain-containing protein [Mycoplasmoides pneumoniae]|uniref:DUF16 domain-containing protein n=1 Tax=Mycoplasmoides pneumoniae TaxID=2104 RepID=UPI0027D950B1|nr:DUF16 domain-containing protein [Mycoplasmoides pneumoniae]